MAIHTPRTNEQRLFLANVEAARAAGVDVGSTSTSVYHALLTGLSYCNFPGWGATPLTDDYLEYLHTVLYDRAVEQGKIDSVRWTYE